MNEKERVVKWNKSHALKSVLLFLVNFLLYIGIAAILLLWDKFPYLGEHMSEKGAQYIYAVFCSFLLMVITYCYFYFEDRERLTDGKSIALIFTILDLHLIISCLIGYQIGIYARPVALVALLVFILMGRRNAIFLNIICALKL